MIPLSDSIVAFLGGAVSILAAGRDADLRPRLSRGISVRLGEDRRSLTVYVADRAGASLIAVLTPGAPVAVTASHVPTHRSVQLKGTVTAVRPAREDERGPVEAQVGGFRQDVAAIGFPLPVTQRLVTWPATAVEVRLGSAFEQTPGPGAGRPVGAA